MPSINFRLTVVARMSVRTDKDLPRIIEEVLNEDELQYQTRKKYETDIRYLAKMYNHKSEDLMPLLEVLSK